MRLLDVGPSRLGLPPVPGARQKIVRGTILSKEQQVHLLDNAALTMV
jgi:hypothetical protein